MKTSRIDGGCGVLAHAITAMALLTAMVTPALAAPPAPQTAGAAARTPSKPPTYRLPGGDKRAYAFDARPQVEAYADLAADSYSDLLNATLELQDAISQLLASPSDESLVHARDCWVRTRRFWAQTQIFRFYDGPVDVADTETNEPGPLYRLDGAAVDPKAIDYVESDPTSGLVNDMKVALTRRTLLDRERAPGGPVTTGWHAVEFMLWGEEPGGIADAGDRPFTDFIAGQPNNDRRRAYLKLITDLLVEDVRYLDESWKKQPTRNYATAFRVLNQREALGRMLNGAALLAAQDLATDRLATALDSKDRRTLPSRFSGTTYQDFVFALRGIRNLWTGDYDDQSRAGLGALVGRVDPVIEQRIHHALDRAETSVAFLYTPLERATLPAPTDSPPRRQAERAIADLKRLASLLRDAVARLGVAVNLPD